MSKHPTHEQLIAKDTNLRAGLTKNHKKSDVFVVAGKEVTVAAAVAMLDERIAAILAADVARREWGEAVSVAKSTVKRTAETLSEIRAQIISRVGKTAPGLADYGIAPRKQRRALGTDETAAKIAKALATRQARHTLGPRAKLAVKGGKPVTTEAATAAATTTTSATSTTPAPAPEANGATPH